MDVNVGNVPYSIAAATFTAVMNAAISDVNAVGGGVITVPAVGGGVYIATDWLRIKSNVAIVFADLQTIIDFTSLPNTRWAMVVNDGLGATLDRNVSITGGIWDMGWEGEYWDEEDNGPFPNRAGGSKFVSPAPPEATYRMGFQFCGVDGLTLDTLTIRKPRNWSFAGNRTYNVNINEVTLDSHTSDADHSNEGTFQFQGENAHIRITNLRGTSNDDMLAFVNAWMMGPTIPGDGPMTDIVVDGIFLNTDSTSYANGIGNTLYERSPLNGIRIETGVQLIDDITITNIVGRVRNQLFEFGTNNYFATYGNYGPGNIGRVTIDGWNVSTSVTGVANPPTTMYPSVSYINGRIDTLILKNFTIPNAAIASPPLWITPSTPATGNSAGYVKNLILDNFDTTAVWSVPLLRVDGEVENLHVKNWGGQSSNYVTNAGTVGNIYLYGEPSWATKLTGCPTPTSLDLSTEFDYTSTPTQAAASYPQNLSYDGAGVLSWNAVAGATTYTVYHQQVFGLEQSPFYSITDEVLGTTGATTYNLPVYTSGHWHCFSVKADNIDDPARSIYAYIGSASATGQNAGFIEDLTIVPSGGDFEYSGRISQPDIVITPLIASGTVSAVTYPTPTTFTFTASDNTARVWGVGDGGVTGPQIYNSVPGRIDTVTSPTAIESLSLILTYGVLSIDDSVATPVLDTVELSMAGGSFTLAGITSSTDVEAFDITLSVGGTGIRSPSGINYIPRSITGEQLTIRRYSNGAWT
jgi:hypothetical protein